MATECVNLLERYGDRFKITWDPAYDPKGVPKRCLDPWYMQLKGRSEGVYVYPKGGDILCIECDYRPGLLKKLLATGLCSRHQDGDGEHTLCLRCEGRR
jgi:hypothetical protein